MPPIDCHDTAPNSVGGAHALPRLGRLGRAEAQLADRRRGVRDAAELPGAVALDALQLTLGGGDDHRFLLARDGGPGHAIAGPSAHSGRVGDSKGAMDTPGAAPRNGEGAAATGSRPVLVLGATGYIGRRLVERAGRGRPPGAGPGAHPGQARRRGVVRRGRGRARATCSTRRRCGAAFEGVGTAYYLVHSIGGDGDWEERDRQAAANVRDAAADAGAEQLVYLGGLGDDANGRLSPHLRSRHEVGQVLAVGRGAVHRAAGRGGDRLGQCVVRDAAPPGRGAADDGHPDVGRDPVPAHRRARRARLPRRRARRAEGLRPGARDRWGRRAHLPPDDGPVRRGRRPAHAASSSPCRCSRRRSRRTGSGWSRPCPPTSPAR